MTSLRSARTAASVAVAALVLTVLPQSAGAESRARAADPICRGHAAIPASVLAGGVAGLGCSLVGRTVVAGRASAVVPPDGMSVAGSGIAASGEVAGLEVDNDGGVVRATVSAVAGRTAPTSGAPAVAAKSPGACQDKTFHLYGSRHAWRSPVHWRINVTSAPKRDDKTTVVNQIRKGNRNLRTGHNQCGKPAIDTPASLYGGRTTVKPNIRPGVNDGATCGQFNRTNVVGFGNLPGLLFGWTCIWWSSAGPLMGVDIMLGRQKELVTQLPSSCSNRWDFEGIATHEWGHGYGLAHTGPGHENLTMQHLAKVCSTYQRTLGLGDWLGLKKLYGVR
jgi:hypothetical protein